MTSSIFNVPADGISPAELAQLQQQLDGTEAQKAQRTATRGTVMPVIKQDLTIRDGQIVHNAVTNKAAVKAHTVTTARPGFISVPGMGDTPVEAAKAGGLIPLHWKEGDPLPFDQAPKAAPKGNPKGTQPTGVQSAPADAPKADAPKAETDKGREYAAHIVKIAGDILHGVDQMHGPGIADALLDDVADSGDTESVLDRLPQGVSPMHVKQVMAGYIAQANDMLSSVGASVPMLQELLTDDELRQARRATLAGLPEDMTRLGQIAVERLAKMPESDPETFLEMVEGMDAKARKMIRQDRTSGEWRVNLPGRPEMTYGAAVRMGLIKV